MSRRSSWWHLVSMIRALDRTRLLTLPIVVFAAACSGDDGAALPANLAGGAVGNGGQTGQGGGLGNGGQTVQGGLGSGGVIAPSPGGSTSRGGASSTGGQQVTGGAPNTGGKSTGGLSSGGVTASGGTSPKGGGSSLGGIGPTGGASPAGGSNVTGGNAATGGAKPAGGSTTTGGTSATGGAAAAGGASGRYKVCNFSSGLNVAWVNFANDVPNPNISTFNTIFKNTYNAGGRVIRWWFHTNGTVTPGYDSSGLAKSIVQSHIDGVKAILDAANNNGVTIVLSLWSFDMLQSNAGSAYTNNKNLLEVDANRQAYVDLYLTPLVNAIKGHPGLYAWEIFNEPEGMGPNGWATYRTTLAAIQKTVNWCAAAIHTADPSALVTSSAVTMDYCSTVSGKQNLYSDTALRNVGGKQNGTLDFYQVHYYTSNGTSNSVFMNAASHWGLTDKKLVIGEFAAQATEGVAKDDLHKKLYDTGYNGAWAWSYDADWLWPAMQVSMQNLFNAYADIGDCPRNGG